ncbi:MAG: hypothetical protein LBJ07_04605 [Actinomycetes bacterium]|nr:hypothetical protein [Actinomycetes bacterium]
MKDNITFSNYLKGDNSMKKTLFVLVLAMTLVLAFSAVAMAKYAGAFSLGQGSSGNRNLQGYLKWDGANAIYKRDTTDTNDQATPHGGYSTTSVKCVVCHSAHRATADKESNGTIADNHLTTGGNCLNCHTDWGGGGSAKKIEYAEDPADRNPHAGSGHGKNACTYCHGGGIHGTGGSKFYVFDAYMLGGSQDEKVEEAVANGNFSLGEGTPWANTPTASGRTWVRTNLLPLPASGVDGIGTESVTLNVDGNNRTWATTTTGYGYWWVNGDGRYYSNPGTEDPRPVPVGSDIQAPQPDLVGDATDPTDGSNALGDTAFAAAKAMATGYTCAQEGCHTNSQFAVNSWGYGESHDARSDNGTVEITGHGTGAWMHAGGQPSCAPCHPAGAAGGYRLTNDGQWGAPSEVDATNAPSGKAPRTAMAFGCDQCHDMVGVSTNSTAWPHGTSGIDVYEWSQPTIGTVATKSIKSLDEDSHNLWMYAYDIGVAATRSELRGQGGTTTYDIPSGDSAAFAALPDDSDGDEPWDSGSKEAYLEDYEANADGDRWLVSANGKPQYWNGNFKVIEKAVTGTPETGTTGVIKDSVCLKCHVAIDRASVEGRDDGVDGVVSDYLAVNPGGISSHHHYYVGDAGELRVLPEEGEDSWNIGTHGIGEGQEHYIGHAQVLYLFK